MIFVAVAQTEDGSLLFAWTSWQIRRFRVSDVAGDFSAIMLISWSGGYMLGVSCADFRFRSGVA